MKVGVFTKSLIIDKMVYGVTMGTLCLVAFVAVVYGRGNGQLGKDCNQDFNDTCDVVFKARATVFAVLTFTLLMTAWEVKDFNASLFNMKLSHASTENSASAHGVAFDTASESSERTPWFQTYFSVFSTLYSNRFLFWACITGFALVFPLIYLPEVNLRVFKHQGIGWEWGVVVGLTVVYVAVIECWKAFKRSRAKRHRGPADLGEKKMDDGENLTPDAGSVLNA